MKVYVLLYVCEGSVSECSTFTNSEDAYARANAYI